MAVRRKVDFAVVNKEKTAIFIARRQKGKFASADKEKNHHV